jgi:ABC-type dipeptide/oligopeptide/nickel transport system permease component
LRFFRDLLLLLIGIIIICNLPNLLIDKGLPTFNVSNFLSSIGNFFIKIQNPSDITYLRFINYYKQVESLMFPEIWERLAYSLTILSSSIMLAITISILSAYIYYIGEGKLQRVIRWISVALNSVPDVMMIICIQLFFIALAKQFKVMPFTIITFNENKAYFLPILCLTILPTVQLFQMILTFIESEADKTYVEFAKAKGLSKTYIFFVHMTRNIAIHLIHQSKIIFLFLISNLFILENLFNIYGIMRFVSNVSINIHHFDSTPLIVSISLLLLPFYMLMSGLKSWVIWITKRTVN